MTDSTTPPSGPIDVDDLRRRIIESLRTVYDPEIPVNLYDLGLIYALDIDPTGDVRVTMTLTTPNCPVAESMPGKVRDAVKGVEDVRNAAVTLTWEPPWTGERMTEDARMALDMMGISWKDPHGSAGATRRITPITLGRTGRGGSDPSSVR